MAETYLDTLTRVRGGREEERLECRSYEGLLSAGVSAGDQLAEAVAGGLGLTIRSNAPDRLLSTLERGDAPPLGELAPVCRAFLCLERDAVSVMLTRAAAWRFTTTTASTLRPVKAPGCSIESTFAAPFPPTTGRWTCTGMQRAMPEAPRDLAGIARRVDAAIKTRRERAAD